VAGTLAAYLHRIDPFALRISGEFGIRWYGLAYLAGFLVAFLLLRALARRGRILLSPTQVTDYVFAMVVGVVVGGRLGYVLFYQPALLWEFSADPPWWGLLAINRGGMASHGGMLGALAACWWFSKRQAVPTLHLLDLAALSAPAGLLFGRIANFVNGELLGRIVAPPGGPAPWWSVKFPQELLTRHAPLLSPQQQAQLAQLIERFRIRPEEPAALAIERMIRAVQRRGQAADELARELAPLLAARHPSQLYQAAAEGIALGAALWLLWRRPRRPGVVTAWFLLLYGALRVLTELWRLPDDHLKAPRIMGLSRGQLLSLLMIVGGAVLLAVVRKSRAAPVGGWGRRSEMHAAAVDR